VWKVQASKLTLEGWRRKRGLGSGNPSPQRGGASGEAHYEPMRGRKTLAKVEATGRRRGGKGQGGCARTKTEATVGRWEEELRAKFL